MTWWEWALVAGGSMFALWFVVVLAFLLLVARNFWNP